MKKLLYFISLLLIISVLWSCNDDDDDNEPVSISTLEMKEFTSEALIDNHIGNSAVRKMQVYTPAGYDQNTTKDYPVVYLLPSVPFTENTFILKEAWDPYIGGTSPFKDYPDFPDEGFKEWIDGLILSGKIQPMIIVMPNAATERYGFSFYSNSELNGNFEDYIVNDLMAYIDGNYRTIANKDGRAVIGVSQGGYGAIKFGMLHSDKYGVVAAHSGMLFLDGPLSMGKMVCDENPDGFEGPHPAKFWTSGMYAMCAAWSPNLNNPPFMVDLPFEHPSGAVIAQVRARFLEHDVYTLMNTHQNQFKSLHGIYIDHGVSDEISMGPIVKAFADKMEDLGIEHTYKTYEGGHFDKMFSRLEVSLEFCSDRMN